ncbi:MAG: Cobalamin-binding protein precursor [Methanosaeta sp. PtaU1.Bin112]|nr:MAG: Cobalamin-binding protein precursor [Methanosaeta sp. PtaU1.Bin112]
MEKSLKRLLILISCVFSVFMPAMASDYTVEVFGNANMDDSVDENDIAYINDVIKGTSTATELSDANYDGKINEDDIAQIEKIIDGNPEKLTLIDGANRTVTIDEPISRVVVCFPHALETLRTLKVPMDGIVGAARQYPEYDPGFFPEADNLLDVGKRWDPDIEKIVTLKPDLVLFTASSAANANAPATIKALESAGIKVLCFSLNGLESYPKEIGALGYVFNKEKEAKDFIGWRDNILNTIKKRVKDLPDSDRPKVYFEAGTDGNDYKIYGEYAYISLCGGNDIFSDLPGKYTSVSPDAVVARKPDIIIKVESVGGGYELSKSNTTALEDTSESVSGREILQQVPAVENDRVYVIAVHLLSFFGDSGCRSFMQVAYQAKWLHPELFEDLDPEAIHQEYLTRFQGLDCNLSDHGVFVYPPSGNETK